MQSIKFEFSDNAGTQYSVVFTVKQNGEMAVSQPVEPMPAAEQAQEPDEAGKPPLDEQWMNWMAYDGRPQTRKEVNEHGDKD